MTGWGASKVFTGIGIALRIGLTALVAACGATADMEFPVEAEAQAALEESDVRIIQIGADNIADLGTVVGGGGTSSGLASATSNWAYRVGPGDVLSIIVWDHPELTMPAGAERSAVEAGNLVNHLGTVFYPYVGRIEAGGRTVDEIQVDLTAKLAAYIPEPQIEVKVAQYNAHRSMITGAIARPGSVPLSNLPITLLEGIDKSGGLTPLADSRRITIRRGGKTYRVNLRAFLTGGAASANPLLQAGDVINVPEQKDNVAYVLGHVTTPAVVPLGLDGANLTEVITGRGGLDDEMADARGIFVFRQNASAGGIDVYQLDATSPTALVLGTKFTMHPQDVVFVTADPAARWNAIVASILPTLGAVRGGQVIAGGSN